MCVPVTTEKKVMVIRPIGLIRYLGLLLFFTIWIAPFSETLGNLSDPTKIVAGPSGIPFLLAATLIPIAAYRWMTTRGVLSEEVVSLRGLLWTYTFPGSQVAGVEMISLAEDSHYWIVCDHEGKRICKIPAGVEMCRDYQLFLQRLNALGMLNVQSRLSAETASGVREDLSASS